MLLRCKHVILLNQSILKFFFPGRCELLLHVFIEKYMYFDVCALMFKAYCLTVFVPRPGGSVVSVPDSWPGGCEFHPRLSRFFFPA